ncbi:MAG: hypothetical protein ACYTXA_04985 [Nostoc sp.]
MPRVTELLNQIVEWVQQYNSEEWPDEPDFDTSFPNYPSLTAMLEKEIRRLKFVWKIS